MKEIINKLIHPTGDNSMIAPQNFICYNDFRDRVVNILTSKVFVDTINTIASYYDSFPNHHVTTNVPIIPGQFELQPVFRSVQNLSIIGHDVPLWYNAEYLGCGDGNRPYNCNGCNFPNLQCFLKCVPLTKTGAKFLKQSPSANYKFNNDFDTVMLISRDPRRTDVNPGQIQLSSPWAMHGANYSKKLMRFVVAAFLKAGKNVYITDYSKLYVAGDHNKGVPFHHIVSTPSYDAQMQSILLDEWNLLNNCGKVLTIQLGCMAGESSVRNFLQAAPLNAIMSIWKHPADYAHGASYQSYLDEIHKL